MSRTVGLFAVTLSVLAATAGLGAIVLVSEDHDEHAGLRAPPRPLAHAAGVEGVKTAALSVERSTLATAAVAEAPAPREATCAGTSARAPASAELASEADVRAALERCSDAVERRRLVRTLKLLRHRASPRALADAPEPDLNGIAHARAVEVLPEQLALVLDPARSSAVRAAAAGALGSVATEQAEGYLLEALAHGDAVARALSAQRLARRESPPSPAAVDVLLGRVELERDDEAARACVEALGASGAAAAVPPLLVRAARGGPIGEAARRGLVRLRASGADVPLDLALAVSIPRARTDEE